jgi:hypothetical protein
MTDTDTDAARTTNPLRGLDAEPDAVESAEPRVANADGHPPVRTPRPPV